MVRVLLSPILLIWKSWKIQHHKPCNNYMFWYTCIYISFLRILMQPSQWINFWKTLQKCLFTVLNRNSQFCSTVLKLGVLYTRSWTLTWQSRISSPSLNQAVLGRGFPLMTHSRVTEDPSLQNRSRRGFSNLGLSLTLKKRRFNADISLQIRKNRTLLRHCVKYKTIIPLVITV